MRLAHRRTIRAKPRNCLPILLLKVSLTATLIPRVGAKARVIVHEGAYKRRLAWALRTDARAKGQP